MCLRACAKYTDSDFFHACTNSHPGMYSPLMHSIESNDSVRGLRRPSLSANRINERKPSSVCAGAQNLAVRRHPKARFRMMRPIYHFICTRDDQPTFGYQLENIFAGQCIRNIPQCKLTFLIVYSEYSINVFSRCLIEDKQQKELNVIN